MIGRTALLGGVLWVAVLTALTTGCAHLDVFYPSVGSIARVRQQRTVAAVQAFEAKRASAELQAAVAAWSRGNPQACKEGLRRVLQRNPNHRDAQLLMAEVCLVDGRPQEAFNLLQEGLRAHPDDPVVHYATATLLDAAGERRVALACYQRAAELEPGSQLYAVGYQTALQAAEPSGGPALDPPGPVLAASGSTDRVASAASVDSAEAAEMDQVRSLLGQGQKALTEGCDDVALVCFQEAASVCPDDPHILITAAMAALREERPEVVVRLLRPAEQQFRGSAHFYRILGTAQYRLGDYESSQVSLRQALSLDKSSALSYFLMGCTLSKLGETESAEAHLRQAGTIDARYAAL